MELIQKVAIVMVLSILSQIVCCDCMPRNLTKSQLKSNAKKFNSQNVKSMKNTVSLNNLTAVNNLKAIRFPNVEYPFESDIGEYYRLLNDHPLQCKPKDYTSNNYSCQVQTNKIETKYKRKFDRAAKAKSRIMTYFTEGDLDASIFPEVEYPLSARDMWIPKYSSRLPDVKRNGNVETDKLVDRIASKNTGVSNNDLDYKYENLALNTLIRNLNTKKTQVTDTSNNEINIKVSNASEPDEILDVAFSIPPCEINIDKNPGPSTSKNGSRDDTVTTSVNTNNNVIYSIIFTPHEDSYENSFSEPIIVDNSCVFNSTKESIADNVTTMTNMSNTKNNYLLSIPEEDKDSQADAHPQMLTNMGHDRSSIVVESANLIPRDLSRPIHYTSTQCPVITITPDSNPSTNIFTAIDYYNNIPSMISEIGNFDLTDATTDAPFEYVTYPMSSLGTLTNNIMFEQPTTTAQNHILTTNPPSLLGSGPTLSNSYLNNSIFANYSLQNYLDNDQDKLTKNWTLNPNNSYTTCQFPEDSDDWVIYVDTEKSFLSQENISDYTMIEDTYVDGLNCYLGIRPQTSNVVNYTLLLTTPDDIGDESNQSQEVPKYIPNNYPVLNIINSVKAITETGNVDLSNSLISSCHSCPSSTLYSMQKDYQSRDHSTSTSTIVPTIPKHIDDSCIPVNDTENTTQSMAGNEYESDNNTSEEPISKTNDTEDQFLYLVDSSNTLQYEYIDDDASASVTEIPYDLVL